MWDILDGYPDQSRPPLSQVTRAAAMPRFADYHRTAIGYHGTRKSAALRVVQRLEEFIDEDPVDRCRAVFVPSNERLWTRSGVYRHAHIQLCVRNPHCILGTWLVQPIED